MWRTSKLVRCPFCNSEAEYDELHKVFEGSDCTFDERSFYTVRCKGCGLTLTSRVSKADAILKWNRRRPLHEIILKLTDKAIQSRGDSIVTQFSGAKYGKIIDEFGYGKYLAYEDAIEIVKEVGGFNE